MENIVRNVIVAIASGLLFGLAWWLMIDVIVYYPDLLSYNTGIVFLPISLSTMSFLTTSLVPNSSLYENYPMSRAVLCHRFIFFFAMTLGFAGVLSSVVICTTEHIVSFAIYAILGIVFSNVLVLAANIAFKFAMAEEDLIC